MTKEIVFIPLTKGRTAFIDPEDFEKVGFEEWYLQTCPSGGPYATNKRFGLMHRHILQAPAGVDVDHINRDTLDNRRENLRLCSRSQNCHNQKIRSTNTSGFKGVCRRKGNINFPWAAYIMCGGKRFHLGYFAEAAEAGRAYNEAAEQLQKDFARPNTSTTEVPAWLSEKRKKGLLAKNSSGFTGVTKSSNPFNPWIARVLLNGKRHFLGCFASPEDAAKAIQDAKGQTSINLVS